MPSYVPGYDTEGLLPYVIWGVSQDIEAAIDGPLRQERAAAQAWAGIG